MGRLTNSYHGSSVVHSVSEEHKHIGMRQSAIGRGIHKTCTDRQRRDRPPHGDTELLLNVSE